MTKNQIEYHKLLETQRSNQANEAIQSERNAQTYDLGLKNYGLGLQQLAETSRHNVATEQLNKLSLDETSRHNLQSEYQNAQALLEQQRHSRAVEAETNRANLARESETTRANIAAETERNRANLASEALRASELVESQRYHSMSIGLGYSQLAETARSNQAREAETKRSNLAYEAQQLANLQESARHSLVVERETSRANAAREAETQRANQASEAIAKKRNKLTAEQNDLRAQELENQRWRTLAENVRDYSQAASNMLKSGSVVVGALGGF